MTGPSRAHAARLEMTRDACRRFSHLPSQTIARHLLFQYPDMYDNSLETARHAVRKMFGKDGKQNREFQTDKSLYRDQQTVVQMPQTWRKDRPAYHLPHGLWLILADAHIPFHDPVALEAAIQAGQAEQVDGILLLGDWQDCASVSFWPTVRRQFHKEIESVIDSLDFLIGQFPNAKIVYKPGNHEYRLPRYYVSHAPELVESPLAAMETILGFESRGIEFLDYHQLLYAGELPVIHGHEVPIISKAVNAARGLFLRAKTFSLCAHCHQTSQHSEKDIHGTLLTTWSVGCLCDLQPEYAPLCTSWNNGFALINVEKDGNFEVLNRRVLASGKVV